MSRLKDIIIDEILKQGKIYEVGGVVRDRIISPVLKDQETDYLVCGIPMDELISLLSKFGKVDLVGKSFGVIKFMPFKKFSEKEEQKTFDIALPRKEYSTGVGHKDFKVEFDHNLKVEDDLYRRDFTINAMAYDLKSKKLIDPLDGKKDIKNRLIRITNSDSFKDDPLRMLRGVQFAARFEFEIEKGTYKSLMENAGLIKTISPERIQEELNKLLTRAKRPSIGFRLMHKTGLLKEILPELEACVGVEQPGGYHKYDVFEHSLETVDNASMDLVIRLASLFHDIFKPQARELTPEGATFYGHEKKGARVTKHILQRLRYSNEIIAIVTLLVDKHMFAMGVTDKGLRRLIRKITPEHIFELLEVRRADIIAQGKGGDRKDVDEFEKWIKEELEREPPFSVKDLKINGDIIMEKFGLSPGPIIGKVLNHLLEKVLDEPEFNQEDLLLKEAEEFLKRHSHPEL
ncbi:MAG: CCA tRNA nucleotidyltransferase [candidate division Zixibacteria bacterium]|nr:CCA tRNA nucleotidyltransferase [candidate division Zixibacteria bacterium]